MTRRSPELLAPAGSWEALTAAVRCGADAVYLGGGKFNARRHATAFAAEDDSLSAAVAYCHARGVAVHVALNTLIAPPELDEAVQTALDAADAGADALIIQDRGLARVMHSLRPDLPLHASTQLSCHTPAGVDRLRQDGFSRVVLAREMTKDEIAACVGRGCEIEVFVHGALCMSVSGQCELSALLGGRSGNRGLCAQPCRLPFAVGGATHALSLKDQSLLDRLAELTAIGVDSLKIEGRMKRPEYVAAATTAFRRALDGCSPDRQLNADLQAVFSRSGFTDGYFTDRRDKAMFGTRRHEDVTAADPATLSRLARLYDKEPQTVPVTAHLTVTAGAPATLTLSDGTHTVTAAGETPQPAVNRPLSAQRAAEQLKKTGGTPFAVSAVTADLDPTLTLPLSALNALRRQAVDDLLARRCAVAPHRIGALPPPIPLPDGLLSGLVARVAREEQINGVADHWVVPLGCRPAVDNWGVEIPRGLFGAEDDLRRRLAQAKADGAAFALCGNIGAIPLALEAGLSPVGGWSLHITNQQSLSAAAESGLQAAVLSFELTLPQLRFARGCGCAGLFAYGRQPLMLLRNCPVKVHVGCAACGGHGSLTDRKGVAFPVMCAGGCSELLNSVPLYLADRPADLRPFPFLYLHFTDESPARVAAVLDEYRRGGTPPAAFTRGLYDKGWARE